MNVDWNFSVSTGPLEFILGCRSGDRNRLMGFLRSLAANPYQKPDFEERDEIGRTVRLRVVGRFMVSYWLDHAVKELRIIHIEIV